ncbi:hypothetical protein F5884DRAFT_791386 [Xylogone sp. PMI_703]|nr:hypothetical protein F5884DRAFT_791386 [Xylogone sp. PMI_703]
MSRFLISCFSSKPGLLSRKSRKKFQDSEQSISSQALFLQQQQQSAQSWLVQLPPELIYTIADLLPPESTAALSLTCRYLYNLLRKRRLKLLKVRRNRYQLAALIAWDLPDHIACFHCNSYHHVTLENAPQFVSHSPSTYYIRECIKRTCANDGFQSTLATYFNPIVFRMVMKRYRQNRPYHQLLSLLNTNRLELYDFSIFQWNDLSCRIYKNRLIARREVIHTPKKGISNLPRRLRNISICHHLAIAQLRRGRGTYSLRHVFGYVTTGESLPEELTKCAYCFTEFEIRYQVVGGTHTDIVCTIWKDLGEGKSYLDPVWQGHVMEPKNWGVVDFELGSIRSAFEQGGPQLGSSRAKPSKKNSANSQRQQGLDKIEEVRRSLLTMDV